MSTTQLCLQWSAREKQLCTQINSLNYQSWCKRRKSENSSSLIDRNKMIMINNVQHIRQLKNNNIINNNNNSNELTNVKQRQCNDTSDCRTILTSDCVLNNDCADRLKFSKTLTRTDSRKVKNAEKSRSRSIDLQRQSILHHSWLVLMVIFAGLICTSSANECATGIKTPGHTWPAGDITLEYGQPLRILCMLNKTYVDSRYPGKNASDLIFIRNYKVMEPEYISIVNETTIELYVEKPPPARDMYYCKLRIGSESSKEHHDPVPVCLNSVAIGFKPQEPEYFKCTSRNWDELTCTWKPIPNYVDTKFNLTFKLPGRAGRRKNFGCPVEKELAAIGIVAPPNTCIWNLATNPVYRQPYDYYAFTMLGINVLGTTEWKYKFHHFGHVIPANPQNLTVLNKTSDSAYLYWRVGHPLQSFPPGLHHRITYQDQWAKTWKVIDIVNDVHAEKRFYNLTNLEYANTVYDVRVSMRSTVATGEDTWGNFSVVTFRTAPRLPGLPPKTDIGSFEIVENSVANRDVYLYWQTIPPYLENGDNFKYQVISVEENGRNTFIVPNETTRTYAKFKGISFNSYRFVLTTSNIMGTNPERAEIFIPSQRDKPGEPLAFTKIAFDEGIYELSWKPPLVHEGITSYTIFWCDNERDRPYQCTGYLDWESVPGNTTIHNITVPYSQKVYQFAISANTINGSSGMSWASCTIIHNRFVGKMKSVWINTIASDTIDVGWKLDCSDRIGIVEGFNIYYCPIVSPHNRTCKEPPQNRTIPADPQTIRGIVTGLKPYTTYMITVAVFTKNGEGLHSNPLLNTTLEAAPSTPPLNVVVRNVTNSTMFVTWEAPQAMNGHLRYYEVTYAGNKVKVERSTVKEAAYVLLKDLLAYKNYTITVTACTVKCSVESPPIYQLTAIGKPGKIARVPNVRFINSTHMHVTWAKPQQPGGTLNYYQISTGTGEIHNSSKLETVLPIPDCKTAGHGKVYKYRVRAVNIDRKGRHLIGPWSDAGENNCYTDISSQSLSVVIYIVGCLALIIAMFFLAYMSKKMWIKCKAMQDVEVKLPPGLATHEKLLQKGGEQHTRQSSADSSNLSVAQESLTSSLTATSHVSADSGTDVVTANKLLEPPTSWETSSLRQRNVGATKPGPLTDATRWDSYVKVTKPGEVNVDETLSLARSTPNLTDSSGFIMPPQTWSSTGYISMTSEEELSSNPSLVPGEETTGHYSVVGVLPSAVKSKSKAEELSESLSNTLMAPRADAKPYVCISSLDGKLVGGKPMDLRDLNELAFIEQSPIKVEPLMPTIAADQNKPYVQVGLMDNLKMNFTPTFTSPAKQIKPDGGVSKGYVAVDSLTDIQLPKQATKITDDNRQSPSQQQQQRTQNIADTSNKPYVQVSTVFQMLQQPNTSDDSAIDTDEIDKSLATSYPLYWESKNLDVKPALEVDTGLNVTRNSTDCAVTKEMKNSGEQSKISPYVQHQRLDKHTATTPSTTTATTDEQYSKVGVAPPGMQ